MKITVPEDRHDCTIIQSRHIHPHTMNIQPRTWSIPARTIDQNHDQNQFAGPGRTETTARGSRGMFSHVSKGRTLTSFQWCLSMDITCRTCGICGMTPQSWLVTAAAFSCQHRSVKLKVSLGISSQTCYLRALHSTYSTC